MDDTMSSTNGMYRGCPTAAPAPKRTYVPDFLDLVHSAVNGIEHDEFQVKIRHDEAARLSLFITSETRHHEVPARPLDGSESVAYILCLACRMVADAMAQDAAYRFRFQGVPIFA